MLAHRQLAAVAALMSLGLGVAACQATPPKQTAAHGRVAQLVLPPTAGTTGMVENFNPFSPSPLDTSYMFESLYVYDSYSCVPHPWLATKYTWSNPKTLVFTAREGVKWSDGKPFGAKDVAYTFNLLKTKPALDTNGLWKQLASVSASGRQITFTFTHNAGAIFQQIATTPILPEHVWSKVRDPEKFVNKNPVVTGPYLPKSFNPQQLVLKRNPLYWQASKVRVDELVQKTAAIGSVVNLQIAKGEVDWGAAFIPDIQKTVIAKDPKDNHYWFPPGGAISLYLNLTKKPFDDVRFRRALTYAIDRDQIAQKAEYGYVKTASQTGLVVPGQRKWLAPGVSDEGKIPYDPARAQKMLSDAGYQKRGNTLFSRDGTPVRFTFKVEAGYSDWIAAAYVIKNDLAKIGIALDVRTESPDVTNDDKLTGNFDAAFGVAGGSCNMWSDFAYPLGSANTAPIGKRATSNMIRWKNAATDALLNRLAITPGIDQQQAIVHQLEHIMLDQVPFIPLWYGAQWFEYSTRHASGWPDDAHPYADPGDVLLILTHLRPAG